METYWLQTRMQLCTANHNTHMHALLISSQKIMQMNSLSKHTDTAVLTVYVIEAKCSKQPTYDFCAINNTSVGTLKKYYLSLVISQWKSSVRYEMEPVDVNQWHPENEMFFSHQSICCTVYWMSEGMKEFMLYQEGMWENNFLQIILQFERRPKI